MKQSAFISALFVCLLMFTLAPVPAWAYSYGNPNEEAVAENYKQVAAKLNQDPPDYSGAIQVFQSIKGELDMHMGPEPAKVMIQALEDKDKEAALKAYHQVLVLNIARRMESVEKDFKNYEQNKLLLAKARATYEALSPIVKEKDQALDQKVRAAFDEALASLGNPGLFGVGIKEPDQAKYKEKKEEIYKTLQDKFQLKDIEVGHFKPGEGPGNTANAKKTSTGISDLKNWVPLAVIVIVLGFIIFRTMRKRRG
ncbi:hypothetical protein [Aneurinibacillus thermoaerophilus]|uniref:Extracellular protein n=1 Tax=Aneurinibacillus thermoaerophilus TaxID=143495 RepID=A0A1G7ZNT2_ANETH|nr:hypothetical protein [Aneurinibacillus thermoaerophilus]MED0675669.1 hypothetical protein [Aneurinibacillus thermoaerophilus]MED0679927.1 hypothetical protein [Aneurinibacillus thermoaerophilus]MED0735570.1 hypothetical protein [Aneurinibacillus thermoaerophilus]MED0758767.1 hypothetical protein [Aneurinibacillus thermoaerophilus]MED0759457.1 hypothetical protein [Aneurinibacillus thermoaerophilus]